MYPRIVLTVLLAIGAPEKGDDMAETDNVAIATMLLMDGYLDRAAAVLEEVDPNAEGIDQKQYWRLRGIVEMKRGLFSEAARYLDSAIELGDTEPRTSLLLVQAHSRAGNPEAALAVFDEAPPGIRAFPESYLLQGRILYELNRKPQAFQTLDEGFARHPGHVEIERQRLFLLIDLGLYQAAVEASRHLLGRPGTEANDHLAVAEALRKAKQLDQAILLLEEALIRFPGDAGVRTQLASTYLDAKRPLTAAEVLRPAAWLDPEKALFTAELYRRSHKLDRAELMNERVADQEAKLRQRMGLLIERGAYEQAAALHPRLLRLGLLEDEQLAYALAYTFFKIGEHDRVRPMLSRLKDQKLFERGVELVRAVEVCKETGRCN